MELAKYRVSSRVKEGGHNIPVEVIERRYSAGIRNLFDIYLGIVDQVLIFDNSDGKHELIAEKSGNSPIIAVSFGKFNPPSMNSITTLSLFRFTNLKGKVWAFGQMQFAHGALAKVQGLQFYKLMGSGRDLGFSPLPDWGVYALLCVWENEQAANTFFADARIFQQYKDHAAEHWNVFMKPLNTKGLWSGKNPFAPSLDMDDHNPLIAVITRATIKPSKLIPFWRYVPTSQRPIQAGCPGLIYTKGIGEAPLIQMATFSIWENVDALKNFAYNSPEHKEAIKRTHRIDWYKEEMFARFQPYKSTGLWGGVNPLSSYLGS